MIVLQLEIGKTMQEHGGFQYHEPTVQDALKRLESKFTSIF